MAFWNKPNEKQWLVASGLVLTAIVCGCWLGGYPSAAAAVGLSGLLGILGWSLQFHSRISHLAGDGEAASGQVLDLLEQRIQDSLSSQQLLAQQVEALIDQLGGTSRSMEDRSSKLAGIVKHHSDGVDETAASVEELSRSIQANAENVKLASQLSEAASDMVTQGADVMQQALSAMDEINQSSSRISDIIGVIDEIAFQTNLLALNASVEAARAGDQGRGFAVVASEVRNLAQRSGSAAREIKELIQDSVGKVEQGTGLVARVAEDMDDMSTTFQLASNSMSEIEIATSEQAQSIDHVAGIMNGHGDSAGQGRELMQEVETGCRTLIEQVNALAQQLDQAGVGGLRKAS